jgi:tetrahydromethanopterin:alpha-L-glutamate ligase
VTRIAVIGTPGRWSSEHLRETAERIAGESVLVDPAALSLDGGAGRVRAHGIDLHDFDAIIMKKIGVGYESRYADRLDLLRFVHVSGVPTFSAPSRIARVIDRLACTVTLLAHGVPMAPMVVTEDIDEAVAAVERYGRAVAKPLFTSKARGMQLLERGNGTRAALEAYRAAGNPVMYIQERLELPGHDLGVVFLGGEYVTTYARRGAEGAWATAVDEKGSYGVYDPPDEIIELAHKAQDPFGLAFTCVDVAETSRGPVIWEVSAFGGFRGLWEARGIDAAELYVRYVLEQIGREPLA